MEASTRYEQLTPDRIVETVERLQRRISERFPESGLSQVAAEVGSIARQTVQRTRAIQRPFWPLRLLVLFLILVLISVLVLVLLNLDPRGDVRDLPGFVQALDSGLASLVFLGATILFLMSLETRSKRGRALRAIHRLRSLAHIVDMHQLTKTPDRVLISYRTTKSSPDERKFTPFELGRYLDYCSELLSVIGKIAVLYVENFSDPVALEAVDQIENLTTGLARKIWQKVDILNRMAGGASEPPTTPG